MGQEPLTREQMIRIVSGNGSFEFNGHLISKLSDIPSQAEIDAFNAANSEHARFTSIDFPILELMLEEKEFTLPAIPLDGTVLAQINGIGQDITNVLVTGNTVKVTPVKPFYSGDTVKLIYQY